MIITLFNKNYFIFKNFSQNFSKKWKIYKVSRIYFMKKFS